MSAPAPVQRTAIQLFRDCFRLVRHIAPGHSPKAMALKIMVRGEFAKSKDVTNEVEIEALKAGAIRALSNYMLYESGAKDKKLGSAMKKFNDDTRKGTTNSNLSPSGTEKDKSK
mmetsp:Transcript_6772/g.9708  ORF Transcript_6772/g.9708 Transcript_6772/m.9708 type:complete len:114 (-) Transcript_6772:43-384(-)|eukprot:CAMPEP_0194087846 /NCGR_PEP_ID=MMETSP0149-20130528/26746_1 /TAXON_ID=122233 /ORGANISM="Chaetoceros debilis, Strain MM31A-1" /LENGTH=113 /DNA_ID=CAMNT_0038771339 /DNA_START=36 /DNA_END=377 /DNA_ORIENTATION=+